MLAKLICHNSLLRVVGEIRPLFLLLFKDEYGKILPFGETSENLVRARRRVVRLRYIHSILRRKQKKEPLGEVTSREGECVWHKVEISERNCNSLYNCECRFKSKKILGECNL